MDDFFVTYKVDESEDSRNVGDVPLVEILNAIEDTLERSGFITIDEAASAIGRSLGYSRIGSNIRKVVGDALEIAEEGTPSARHL